MTGTGTRRHPCALRQLPSSSHSSLFIFPNSYALVKITIIEYTTNKKMKSQSRKNMVDKSIKEWFQLNHTKRHNRQTNSVFNEEWFAVAIFINSHRFVLSGIVSNVCVRGDVRTFISASILWENDNMNKTGERAFIQALGGRESSGST